MTSCGGKSGGTDNTIVVAKKNIESFLELYLDPVKLSKKIEEIDAMSDEDAKNYFVKEFFEKSIAFTSDTPEDAKNFELKKLKQQLENANTEDVKQIKQKEIDKLNNLSLDDFKKQKIAKLEKTKEDILKKTPADAKKEHLVLLRSHLNSLKPKKPAQPVNSPAAPAP